MERFARVFLWIVALFYLYGAVVHILNMLSLTGFDWANAPFKWQALDVIYLILDLAVFFGLARGWWIGVAAFYTAAATQILLYTVFREWILDVPPELTASSEQLAYLDKLVWFHVITLMLVTAALAFMQRRTA